MQETDFDKAIVDFMRREQSNGRTEFSRAEIQRDTGLDYNRLVEALLRLENTSPPVLKKQTKGMAGVWMLANP